MSHKTALIVDDSKLSRVMIRSILQEHYPDWTILEAANGDEALQIEEDTIDIMTLDMNMPGMDGVSLGRELKQKYPNASISLITANIQQAVRDKADAEGFYFVGKPITEEKILDAVGSNLEASNGPIEFVFDGDELDVISEFFNIGMGQAATAISELLSREVHLSVPSVRFTTMDKTINEMNLRQEEVVVCVSEEFDGVFEGKAIMLFPEVDSKKLINYFNEEYSVAAEQDIMMEVGNILINSSLSTIYNLLDSSYECAIPKYTKHKVLSLFKTINYTEQHQVLVVEMDFEIDSTDISGNFRMLMDLSNVNELKQKIRNQLV